MAPKALATCILKMAITRNMSGKSQQHSTGEALPPSIAALVQRRIQASGQDVRMVNQMRMDRPKTPPKVLGKKRARSPSEEGEDVRN